MSTSTKPTKEEEAFGMAGTLNQAHPEVLVTTMFDVPGYEIVEVYGTMFGITVRSRNFFQNFGAALKSLVGGELTALSKNVETARVSAVDRLVGHAMEKHANAIVAMRFDCSTGGQYGDQIAVTAYGTACKIRKIGATS